MIKYLPGLAVISAAILWSLDGYIRQNLSTLPSFFIISLEHIIGAIIFFPILIKGWGEIVKIQQRGWISVLWISICGGILGTFFYTKALSYVGYINLSVVVLLQKFQPIFAISLASIILKEHITKRFLILALSAIVGGYLITFGNNSMADWDDKTIIAALLALLAAFSWGSSTVLGKQALKQISFMTLTSLRLSITGAITLFIIISTGQYELIPDVSLNEWGYIFLIVITTGSLALFIYYYGLKQLPASHVTLYELFWPLSAFAIDWIFHGYLMTVYQFGGAIILLTSIVLLSNEKIVDNNLK